MPRESNLKMHPFMLRLMQELGCRYLKHMAQKTKISYWALRDYAYFEPFTKASPATVEALSKATGYTSAELYKGFLEHEVA